MYEHENHLQMSGDNKKHMIEVIIAISEFLEVHNDVAIWSISSSHNNVIRIRCEGEEVLTDFLKSRGYTVNTVYLMLEVYPKP